MFGRQGHPDTPLSLAKKTAIPASSRKYRSWGVVGRQGRPHTPTPSAEKTAIPRCPREAIPAVSITQKRAQVLKKAYGEP